MADRADVETGAVPAQQRRSWWRHGGRPDGRRGEVVKNLRLLVVAGLLVLVLVLATVLLGGWGIPPSRQQLLRQAGLDGKAGLTIGVKGDSPGVSLRDPHTGLYSGFDVDIAYLIASDLGFRRQDVTFVPIETEDRARMQGRSPSGGFVTVDIVVASFSMTPAREALPGVTFAGPYLATEQSVVTRRTHRPVQSFTELRGERVCTLGSSTSQTAAAQAGLDLTGLNLISSCIDGLRRGRFDAVTLDAAILAGFVARYPNELVHYDISLETDEQWGVNVGDNAALRTLIEDILYRSATDPHDQRWEEAFDRSLAPLQVASPNQEVAISRQPVPPKVRIRRWPWESLPPGPAPNPASQSSARQSPARQNPTRQHPTQPGPAVATPRLAAVRPGAAWP